tara:strand:+ start:269 stop:670 length:402 start_codon:yes stop_codon:yes gene_type:complete
MSKHKSRTKVTDVFNISSKLRGCDAVTLRVRGKVDSLIKNYPLDLWNSIHNEGSKISLVRTAYFQLKDAVRVIAPEKVILVDKIHKLHKAKKQLIKEINDEMRKVNGKPNDDLINLNRKEIAELNKVIKRINK